MKPLYRLLKYGGVNAVLLPFNFALALGLEAGGVHYLIANACGFAVQAFPAFLINRRWTFTTSSVTTKTGLARTAFVMSVAFVIVEVTTAAGVEVFGLRFLWARVLAVVAVGIWDYAADSYYTFGVRPHH